jgi:hypothetical protein
MSLADSRALSITDWWYWVVLVSKGLVIEVAGIQVQQVDLILTSYDPWEKFMRTTLRPAGCVSANVPGQAKCQSQLVPFRSMEIFSTELVLGPGTPFWLDKKLRPDSNRRTNGTDNGGAAVILLRCIVCVQTRGPFELGPVGQVVQCVTHCHA